MTDTELVSRVIGVFDSGAVEMRGLTRGGRLLLGLPKDRLAAGKALRLYQPQRGMARLIAGMLGLGTRTGLHTYLLRRIRVGGAAVAVDPCLAGIARGTCGMLLGSPEHKVRRAIASYRMGGSWEVAKISFGEAGAKGLEQEARTLDEIRQHAEGVPRLLGFHRGGSLTVLRMPYLTGGPVEAGESEEAISLLDRWCSKQPLKPITEFPEWPAAATALSATGAGEGMLRRLSQELLRPVVCHGDFARWNLLRQEDGKLVALDWEWGHLAGMPGIDLVHYFLQDVRLVSRLQPADAIAKIRVILASPACRSYLAQTGWSGEPLLPVIACLAYKQGAGHQENREVLAAALAAL
ncbi:MAG: phosphotransferase [Verrucomicrobia bacterium]|nr:phosphotransferase [Verrucomicrobiota bacterium]